MVIKEILRLTGASKPSVYRWMEKHPSIAFPDPDTPKGHPFPKPVRKEGRIVHWEDEAVQEWWEANAATIGRHPEEAPLVTMSWESLRSAMLVKPRSVLNEDGLEEVKDHMDMVLRIERHGEEARLFFRNVSDAVLFKLTYS